MLIPFSKYHGTGNDFIMIDNRGPDLRLSQGRVAKLCDRRFGIGADGLILLEMKERTVHMVYFNADGLKGSLCGNGARCFVRFAGSLDVLSDSGEFLTSDGPHSYTMQNELVCLRMNDVAGIESIGNDIFLDTGSPHYIRIVNQLDGSDVVKEGRAIRYNDRFSQNGTNVNFVEMVNGLMCIRTYERGVEDETLSCGTGATASAIALHHIGLTADTDVQVKVLGGDLKVTFSPDGNGHYSDVRLIGPAEKVYDGTIELRP